VWGGGPPPPPPAPHGDGGEGGGGGGSGRGGGGGEEGEGGGGGGGGGGDLLPTPTCDPALCLLIFFVVVPPAPLYCVTAYHPRCPSLPRPSRNGFFPLRLRQARRPSLCNRRRRRCVCIVFSVTSLRVLVCCQSLDLRRGYEASLSL